MYTAIYHTLASLVGSGGKKEVKAQVTRTKSEESSSGEEALELDGEAEDPTQVRDSSMPSVQSRSVRESTHVQPEDLNAALEATHLVQRPSTSGSSASNGMTGQVQFQLLPTYDSDSCEEEESEYETRPGHGVAVVLDKDKSTGQITVLEPDFGCGYIDGMYKFDIAKFRANGPFHRNDWVRFEAIQIMDAMHDSIGWTVTEMSKYVSDEVDEFQRNAKFKSRVVKVLNMNSPGDKVECGDKQFKEYVPKDLVPEDIMIGDWLTVRTEDAIGQAGFGKFLSAEPVQKGLVRKGFITHRGSNYAVVDEDIAVMLPSHCENGQFPPVGKPVRVKYIQSAQQCRKSTFNFRATSVEFRNTSELPVSMEDRANLALMRLYKDKEGVLVRPTRCLQFTHGRIGAQLERNLTVENTSSTEQILQHIKIGNDQTICRFTIPAQHRESDDVIKVLQPKEIYHIKITCEPLQLGWTSDICRLVFANFIIGRELRVKALPVDDITLQGLNKNQISERAFRRGKGVEAKVLERKLEPFESTERKRIRGIQLIRPAFFLPKMVDGSKHYPVPSCLVEACKIYSASQNNIAAAKAAALLYEHFPTLLPDPTVANVQLSLTFENYKDTFDVALWFEELHHLRKKQQHSLEDVLLERSGDCFKIPFPDVRDVHPSFNTCDPLRICDRHNPSGGVYDTSILRLGSDAIYVKLDEAFIRTYDNQPVNVQFRIGRTAYRRCHFAVENAVAAFGENWLFPTEPIIVQEPRIIFLDDSSSDNPTPSPSQPQDQLHRLHYPQEPSLKRRSMDKRKRSLRPMETVAEAGEEDITREVQLRWYNQTLNEEQRNAVRRILRGDARPIPYIIFGPPGTGKTVTVVEAVTQIYKIDTNSRILVTAPSNAAADLICKYLSEIGKLGIGEFVRLVGFNRAESNNIPPLITNYCQDGDNIEAIWKYRIIVCTCNSAGQFFQMDPKLSALHISHVFIDEAGYCNEPDSLIPCLFVSGNTRAQVILAGDPKQLGPTVFDDVAANYSLEGSLLGRLMQRPIYQKQRTTGKYNPLLVTKLVRNYRAHPELLHFPSKCFYDNELIPSASAEETTSLCDLDFLPKKGIPMIFHGLRGEQSKDKGSPSWYNSLEVLQVVHYVQQLLERKCSVDEIGIITPYRKQVDKIREAINKKQWSLPKVGSVEEFQGGEKRIIILSLVRSTDIDEESDYMAKLSFVFNQKRFNVSATRAKALFICVGNPKLFAINPTWRDFLKHCIKKGVYIGTDLPPYLLSYYRKYNSQEEGFGYVESEESDDSN